MWLLAVDSSSRDASVALQRDDRLVVLMAPKATEPQGVALFRWVDAVLRETGISLRDIDVYAAVTGPGSFTGLRLGLTLVKGLAEVHARPVVPVSALEAVCESAEAHGLLAPVLDARRDQVFAALYRKQAGELGRQFPDSLLSLSDFFSKLQALSVGADTITFVTRDAIEWKGAGGDSVFQALQTEVISPVLADAVARCARRRYLAGEKSDALRLTADYLRRSDAEVQWKEK